MSIESKRRASGYSPELLLAEPRIAPLPKPQACHQCEHKFIGTQCPICKTERPTFTAMKKISAAR